MPRMKSARVRLGLTSYLRHRLLEASAVSSGVERGHRDFISRHLSFSSTFSGWATCRKWAETLRGGWIAGADVQRTATSHDFSSRNFNFEGFKSQSRRSCSLRGAPFKVRISRGLGTLFRTEASRSSHAGADRNVYTDVHMYMYMYMYMYMFLNVSVCILYCIHIYVYMYMYMYVQYIYMCVYIYIYMCREAHAALPGSRGRCAGRPRLRRRACGEACESLGSGPHAKNIQNQTACFRFRYRHPKHLQRPLDLLIYSQGVPPKDTYACNDIGPESLQKDCDFLSQRWDKKSHSFLQALLSFFEGSKGRASAAIRAEGLKLERGDVLLRRAGRCSTAKCEAMF